MIHSAFNEVYGIGASVLHLNSHLPGTRLFDVLGNNIGLKRCKRTTVAGRIDGSRSTAKEWMEFGFFRTQSQPTLAEKTAHFDTVVGQQDAYLLYTEQWDEHQRQLIVRLYEIVPSFLHASDLNWRETFGAEGRFTGWQSDTTEDGMSMKIVQRTADQFWVRFDAKWFDEIAEAWDRRVELILQHALPLSLLANHRVRPKRMVA